MYCSVIHVFEALKLSVAKNRLDESSSIFLITNTCTFHLFCTMSITINVFVVNLVDATKVR